MASRYAWADMSVTRRKVKMSQSMLRFAMPSFLEGLARLFDFSGALTIYNDDDLTPREADWLALSSDWRAIGNDIRAATKRSVRVGQK